MNKNTQSAFLLVNKPTDITSHDVIYRLRNITGIKKIGHAGTLDPFASGVLLVAIGDATKLLRHYSGLDKSYTAVLHLGAQSDTRDKTGIIQKNAATQKPTRKDIESVLKSFTGKQTQVPPMFSAKKVGGQRLYKLARKGETISRTPHAIEIHSLALKAYTFPLLTIECTVSSGTYIRALGHDIGTTLGCGAYVEELVRTAVGGYSLRDCVRLEKLTAKNWRRYCMPVKTVLVSGTFDGVHAGHRNYFQQARQFGQRLICIVAHDTVAKRIKGKKPRYTSKERIQMIKQSPEIDRIYLGIDGSEEQVFDFVASLHPEVIALGYDQEAYTKNLRSEMKKRGCAPQIKRCTPYREQVYKSSKLRK